MDFPWQRNERRDLGKVLLIYPVTGMDVLGINVGLPLSCLYLSAVLKRAGYREAHTVHRLERTLRLKKQAS